MARNRPELRIGSGHAPDPRLAQRPTPTAVGTRTDAPGDASQGSPQEGRFAISVTLANIAGVPTDVQAVAPSPAVGLDVVAMPHPIHVADSARGPDQLRQQAAMAQGSNSNVNLRGAWVQAAAAFDAKARVSPAPRS